MAICRNCSAETTRVRTTYHSDKITGKIAGETDECPNCSPGSFEPRWLHERGAIAPEVYPTQFRKRYPADGRVGYFSTDERRADLEAEMSQPSKAEQDRYRKAMEEKRARRRTAPMTLIEIEKALQRWRPKFETESPEA